MKDKERLEITFNNQTERDLWEYLSSLGTKKATIVKNIIRDRMYADKMNIPAAGELVRLEQTIEDVEQVIEQQPSSVENNVDDSTFDAARSPLFKAKEI